MEKWICLLGLAASDMLRPIFVQGDVVFEPVGGEFGSFVIFAAVLAVIVLFVTALLLIIWKKKGRK